jgi:ribosome maturation factor RimP
MEDYLRFSGREVRLFTREKIDSRRRFTGFIEDLRDGVVQLSCQEKTYQIPFGMITKANLVYRFADSFRK